METRQRWGRQEAGPVSHRSTTPPAGGPGSHNYCGTARFAAMSKLSGNVVVSSGGYSELPIKNLEIRKTASIRDETQICHLQDK